MHPLLNSMQVPEAVQQFFGCTNLRFDYDNDSELFAEDFHCVPTTSAVCRRGYVTASLVLLSHSVMEAIAYLTLKRHRYPDLEAVACIALGNLPRAGQLKEVSFMYPKSKFVLLFGNDLLGNLMDIFVACALRGLTVRLDLRPGRVLITCDDRSIEMLLEKLSLHAFQQVFGIRTRCRTDKAKGNTTFLHQLFSAVG